MTTLLAFLFVFGILVFVHELGHFLAARFFGIKVEEFAFGFPPRIWSKKRGDTVYAINLIPFGGYVKLYGEEGEGNKQDPKNYNSKKAWQKTIVLSAGVIMNFILAFTILTGFYLFGGRGLVPGMADHKFVDNNQKVTITEVAKDSPAEESGIEEGSVIKTVNGTKIFTSEEVFAAVQSKVAEDKNSKISVAVEKNGEVKNFELATYTEKLNQGGKDVEIQRIGVTMADSGQIKSVWWAAPMVAISETIRLTKMTFEGLGSVISESFRDLRISDQLGGPVAIYLVTGSAAQLGFSALMQVVAILSLTLAIINIMPFPALDGGHILFITLESLLRREISDKVKRAVNLAGFSLLLLLMVLISVKDVSRFGIFDWVKELFS